MAVELMISEEVAASTEVCDTYIPANGVSFLIEEFQGEAAFTTNAAVLLVWDKGGAGETVIWSTKGSSKMPFHKRITDADGVKKLAVCLDNGETGALYMSGHCLLSLG